jgi:hypothetical protein
VGSARPVMFLILLRCHTNYIAAGVTPPVCVVAETAAARFMSILRIHHSGLCTVQAVAVRICDLLALLRRTDSVLAAPLKHSDRLLSVTRRI